MGVEPTTSKTDNYSNGLISRKLTLLRTGYQSQANPPQITSAEPNLHGGLTALPRISQSDLLPVRVCYTKDLTLDKYSRLISRIT